MGNWDENKHTYDWCHQNETSYPDAQADDFGSTQTTESLCINWMTDGEKSIEAHDDQQQTRGELVQRCGRHIELSKREVLIRSMDRKLALKRELGPPR